MGTEKAAREERKVEHRGRGGATRRLAEGFLGVAGSAREGSSAKNTQRFFLLSSLRGSEVQLSPQPPRLSAVWGGVEVLRLPHQHQQQQRALLRAEELHGGIRRRDSSRTHTSTSRGIYDLATR